MEHLPADMDQVDWHSYRMAEQLDFAWAEKDWESKVAALHKAHIQD